ncbi:MAG: universal stress protein [Pseudomonadota bacterium]
MFSKIMIPVDLAHQARMDKALSVAADLAKRYEAEAHMVGVTMSMPSKVAPSPEAFAEKLAAYAAEQSAARGTTIVPHAERSLDLPVDLDDVLARTAQKIGADLIVMASHVPGLTEHLFASNAGYLASHATMSVLVVR